MAISPMKPFSKQTAVERLRDRKARRAERRGLTTDEINLVPLSLRRSIDIGRVQLIDRSHNPFAANKILTRNNKIYWPDVPDDFTVESIARQAVLIHELCHVWQYKKGHLSLWSYISKPGNWRYGYVFDETKAFTDYRIEEMADIAQDWYLELKGRRATNYKKTGPKPTRQQLIAMVSFSR